MEPEKLSDLLHLAISEGSFTLSSGERSERFLDATKALMRPDGFRQAGLIVARACKRMRAEYIGGPATGALPLICAAMAADASLKGFYFKEREIQGVPPTQDAYTVMVDDVVTTGTQLLDTCNEAANYHGANVVLALALVDRERTAKHNIVGAGYNFGVVYKLSTLI